MNSDKLNDFRLYLGSKSPRRLHLLKELGLQFEPVSIECEEIYPDHLKEAEIARYLCELKADALELDPFPENTILITADTIVWLEGRCIGKPKHKADAVRMLSDLSGKTHTVYTGICLRSKTKKTVFHAETSVTFKELKEDEINYYISHHRPFDKAGSYGIQDWIGYTGVKGINGCFYNVMGFPIQMFWEELNRFVQ